MRRIRYSATIAAPRITMTPPMSGDREKNMVAPASTRDAMARRGWIDLVRSSVPNVTAASMAMIPSWLRVPSRP
jgi:hypothetical protein